MKIPWDRIVPTAVFVFVLWFLQGQLDLLQDITEPACDMKRCANGVANAYWLLTASNIASSGLAAWASWRFNTAFHKPGRWP